VSAYSAAAWHDFFMAAVGASAALLGLLFVSVSINIALILKYPHLPGRAASTLGVMLTVLVVCCFGLAPEQSETKLGWEIVIPTSISVVQTVWALKGFRQKDTPLRWTIGALPMHLVPILSLMGGGISLLVGGGGGLYWVLIGTVMAFIIVSINAWVLMVEILR
jgi:modulator of FtsH protease